LKYSRKKNNSSATVAGVFFAVGALMLLFSMYSQTQVAAFIGLGLVFWGAIFAVARGGKYVESSLLDGTAKSSYSTIERMINDLNYNGQGYYIPAYPQDVSLPEYLKNLREPVVFISDSFDGKVSVDELAAGKFLSAKTRGVFVTAPGSGIVTQFERQMQLDFSKMNLTELNEMLPKCITEVFNLAKNAEMVLTPDGANFKATGILYESLYNPETRLKSVNLLGCPVVSAVASALAKTSSKTVIIKEQTIAPNCSVSVIFKFV
jgi:hypothetical protein